VKDFPIHVLLFVAVSAVIVGMSLVFSEKEDGRALRMFPRRLLWFLAGCGILAAVLLVLEHAFAPVS